MHLNFNSKRNIVQFQTADYNDNRGYIYQEFELDVSIPLPAPQKSWRRIATT